MTTIRANGIDICFEESGSAEHPALLLVNGFTSQLIGWDDRLVELLVDAGFRVIRFDNRDVGLTTKTGSEPPAPGSPPSYTLADMAADGMALLTALGIERAHVVGASMGGMIVQQMAIDHPDRVLSLTSIMSTTGDTTVGGSSPEAIEALLTPPPREREAYLDHSAKLWKIISGPHYDEAHSRDRAARSYDRCFNPVGATYQMAAILGSGDRTERLAGVTCPTLVIHGRGDPLVGLTGGEATAKAIPGAELLVLDDMGHDLPLALIPQIVDAITSLAARAYTA